MTFQTPPPPDSERPQTSDFIAPDRFSPSAQSVPPALPQALTASGNVSFLSGVIRMVIILAIVGGGVTLFGSVFGDNPVYDDANITMTVPKGWSQQNMEKLSDCKDGEVKCYLSIGTQRDTLAVSGVVIGFSLPDNARQVTMKEIESTFWDWTIKKSEADYERLKVEEFILDGASAIRREYRAPMNGIARRAYELGVYFVHKKNLYQVTFSGTSEQAFTDHRAEIEQFIATIKLKGSPVSTPSR